MSYRSRLYQHRNAQGPDSMDKKPFFSRKDFTKEPQHAFFQAKFNLSQPVSTSEQEADSVARNVLNSKQNTVRVQAKPESSPLAASPQLSSRIKDSTGKGKQMPKNILHEMNRSFGVDFGDVKIHHDAEAANMNNDLRAQAFTHKNDI